MASVVDEIIKCISEPSYRRHDNELEEFIPWLRKRSLMLQNLDKAVLLDIMKNCTYQHCGFDDVIIRQGEKGDSGADDDNWDTSSLELEPSFYIILSGTASVYIDPRMTGEEEMGAISTPVVKVKEPPKKKQEADIEIIEKSEDEQNDENREEKDGEEGEEDEEGELKKLKEEPKLMPLDRTKFGKYIMTYEPGKAFGEVALVKRDSLRNASIIADENVDLMVIGQDLYERSLKVDQEKEFAAINNFIESHPYFCNMPVKFKKLLEMSLRKTTFVFDTVMIKQGDPVTGLFFVLSGQAKVIVEPNRHQKQFPHLWPFEAGIDIISAEFEHLREIRRAAVLRKYEDPSVWETTKEDVMIRRNEGYAAVEKWMKEKHIDLCSVQDGEVIGDTEIVLNLNTYMQTVKCTANTDVYILDIKNFERLVGKRNPHTMNVIRESVKMKLNTRMEMKNGEQIPFLKFLSFKLSEQMLPPPKELPPLKTSKTLPDKETETMYLLKAFKDGKAPLVPPQVPGGLYYKDLMKQKAEKREIRKKETEAASPTGVSTTKRRMSKPKRQPRSIMAIRESLREMMEAEILEFESESVKKKLKSKFGSMSSIAPSHSSSQQPQVSQREIRRDKKSPNISFERTANEEKQATESFLSLLSKKDKDKKSSLDLPKTEREMMTSTPRSSSTEGIPKEIIAVEKAQKRQNRGVLVTEISARNDGDLPAIREEKTQEEIFLNGGKRPSIDMKTRPPEKSTKLPEIKLPNIAKNVPSNKKFKDHSTRDVSLDSSFSSVQADNLTSVSLPAIGTSHVSSSDNVSTSSEKPVSKWSTAMKFVNDTVQQQIAQKVLDQTFDGSKDNDFYNESTNLLEKKIDAFHIKYGGKAKRLPKLAKFSLDDDEVNMPRPGGKVWIRKRMCRFADNKVQVKDHKHVRHYIVDVLPQFEQVRKAKGIALLLMSGSPQGK